MSGNSFVVRPEKLVDSDYSYPASPPKPHFGQMLQHVAKPSAARAALSDLEDSESYLSVLNIEVRGHRRPSADLPMRVGRLEPGPALEPVLAVRL